MSIPWTGDEAKIAAIATACKSILVGGVVKKGEIRWQDAAKLAAPELNLSESTVYEFIRRKMSIWRRDQLGLRPKRVR